MVHDDHSSFAAICGEPKLAKDLFACLPALSGDRVLISQSPDLVVEARDGRVTAVSLGECETFHQSLSCLRSYVPKGRNVALILGSVGETSWTPLTYTELRSKLSECLTAHLCLLSLSFDNTIGRIHISYLALSAKPESSRHTSIERVCSCLVYTVIELLTSTLAREKGRLSSELVLSKRVGGDAESREAIGEHWVFHRLENKSARQSVAQGFF